MIDLGGIEMDVANPLLGSLHIYCLKTLLPFLDLVGHGLSLFERLVSLLLNGLEVHKQICGVATGGRDEAISLLIVEPFDGAFEAFSHLFCVLGNFLRRGIWGSGKKNLLLRGY